MRYDFTSVTPQQLSELFPIKHENYNPLWKNAYLKEEEYLSRVFGNKVLRISHIGSTSIPNLIAKPTIDILLEIADETELAPYTEQLLDEGCVVNTPPDDLIMYLKGYTPNGFEGQAVHIHVRCLGDWGELYFRDYLTAHPDIAAEYANLKINLKEVYPNDRDSYTEAKGDFVKKYTELARLEYPNRYNPKG